VANASIFLALIVAPLRDVLPDPLFILAYNGMNLLALCCFASTSVVILSGKAPWKFQASLALPALLLIIGLSLATGLRWPRTVVMSLAAAAIALHAAITIHHHAARTKVRNGPGILSFMFGFAAVFYLLRAAISLRQAAGPGSIAPAGFVDTSSYLVVIVLFTAFDFALLVILMTRLEREIAGKVFEIGESRNELQILYDAFAETAGSVDIEELVPRLLDLLTNRLKVDVAVLYLREPGSEDLQLIAQRGFDADSLEAIMRPQKDNSVAWQAYLERKASIKRIVDYPEGPLRATHERLGTVIVGGFPIAARNESLGALVVGYRDEAGLDAARSSLLETLTLQLGSVVRAASLHDELDRANARLDNLASTDVLTGLANRRAAMRALEREVARARRSSGKIAVIMGDIDHFKDFNDRNGHDCGDYVLAKTASIMVDAVRSTDLAVRWGGEEFLIVLGSADQNSVAVIAERIRKAIEGAVWNFGDKRFSVTITLGVAICPAELGGEAAISIADEALYEGKRMGRNRVTIHRREAMPSSLEQPGIADLEGSATPALTSGEEGTDGEIIDLLALES
ncbi:MAG: GGDEF domain-containing protein, partial [Spirochaetota bacterium]